MDIKELNKKITNKEFSNIYFFYGEEEYLKEFYIERIINSVVDEAMFGFNLFSYKEPISRDEFIGAIDQPPMLSEYKVVYLNNINISKCDADFNKSLLEKLSDIPEFTILIIREIALDKRSKLWLELKKIGELVECVYPSPQDMRAFIGREFGKFGKKISPQLAEKIYSENEKNMYSIISLIEIVSAYLCDTQNVTETAINQFIQKSIDTVVFDLSEALITKQKQKTYQILNDLKLTSTKNPPQVLFSLISRHIMGICIALINQKERIPNSETAKLLGKNIPEFVVSKYQKQASGMSEQKLSKLVIFCSNMDYLLKTGQISDPYIAIYMLFAKFWEIA
jgi:DNA polymerase-3 subunit delta